MDKTFTVQKESAEDEQKVIEVTETVERVTRFSVADLKMKRTMLQQQLDSLQAEIDKIDAQIAEVVTALNLTIK